MDMSFRWLASVAAVLALAACGDGGHYSTARYNLSNEIESGTLSGEPLAMAYLKRGYTQQLDRRYEAALADYDRAVAAAPQLVLAYETRARLLMGLGRFDQALADVAQMIALSPPDNADGHLLRGDILVAKHDYAGALSAYDEALARDQKNWIGYGGRGTVLAELGEDDRALLDLDRAVELDPGTLGKQTIRSCIRTQAQTTPNCKSSEVDISTQAIMGRVYRSRGMIRFKRADYTGAAADLDRSSLDANADTHLHSALAHAALGECREAHYRFNYYERATDTDRDAITAAHRDFMAKTPCADVLDD
jgi:tetratricopeptide (TPR) repeat protein